MSLDAAEQILATEGVQALSVRRIAKSIGYTHGTLYLLFENLDGLLLEVNGRTVQQMAQHLEQAMRTSPPGLQCLHALAMTYLQFARDNNARWRLVFEHQMADPAATPAWLGERIAHAYDVLNQALTRAGAQTEQVEDMSCALFAAIHGATVLALDGKLVDRNGNSTDVEPVLKHTVQVFFLALNSPNP
jgi:AcrR family transcriptional regulator